MSIYVSYHFQHFSGLPDYENHQTEDGKPVLFDTISRTTITNFTDQFLLIEPKLYGDFR